MIADKIVKTAEPLKTENNNVVLTVILSRGDKLNEKAEEMNNLLEKACNLKQIDLIKHKNLSTKRQLNRSKLHFKKFKVTESAG